MYGAKGWLGSGHRLWDPTGTMAPGIKLSSAWALIW
jgi:hypothetical protein